MSPRRLAIRYIKISVFFGHMGDLQIIINAKLHSIPGVRKTCTCVLTNILKQNCNWPFPKKFILPEEWPIWELKL